MKYCVLAGKIVERNFSYDDIARSLGTSTKTLKGKVRGKTPFTWNEVVIMQNEYFPDIDKDTLMQAM